MRHLCDFFVILITLSKGIEITFIANIKQEILFTFIFLRTHFTNQKISGCFLSNK